VFVSLLARDENQDAALWLLREIWPTVVLRVPGARLRLVGRGASDGLAEAVSRASRVELAGFVPDLDEVYAAASACVVPLRYGAGVKFKTIEALLAAVPVVTTSVGAEGIAGPEHFAGMTDDAAEFAAALVGVLRDRESAEAQAAAARTWAAERYSAENFRRAMERIYGVPGRA
jgi:glycosyltransferase involved in cell wall biosynthesis